MNIKIRDDLLTNVEMFEMRIFMIKFELIVINVDHILICHKIQLKNFKLILASGS